MLTKFAFLIFSFLMTNQAYANVSVSLSTSQSQPQAFIQPLDSTFLFYNFGSIFTNSTRYVRYDVTNTGTVPLQFNGADISGSFDFDGYHNCSNGLVPRQQCIFEISYRPFSPGLDFGRFTISFSGNNTIVVDLRGEGI